MLHKVQRYSSGESYRKTIGPLGRIIITQKIIFFKYCCTEKRHTPQEINLGGVFLLFIQILCFYILTLSIVFQHY